MTGRFWLTLGPIVVSVVIVAGCNTQVSVNSGSGSSSAPGKKANQGPVEMELVVAEAGVGKKGQGLQGDDVNKMIAQPVIVLRKVEQDIVFKTAAKYLREYELLYGEIPQTLEEYREKIVKPHGHDLPELPEGHEYVWKPEEKQLYVRRPKATQ